MNLRSQRRMAADILKCGVHRVWIDPERMDEVARAQTKDDIRRLIKEGVIRKKPIKGQSRVRARKRHEQRKKGRQRGPGRRKGAKGARMPRKRQWIQRIRAIRRELRRLRDEGKIDRSTYRKLYMMAKGGYFRDRSHLLMYIEEHDLWKK
ncbi:MAG: 50S ribosomal protein L19e [Methanopyri archaeon]|nr:50S ribosomal protein L19e [Methanopyri archaeon]